VSTPAWWCPACKVGVELGEEGRTSLTPDAETRAVHFECGADLEPHPALVAAAQIVRRGLHDDEFRKRTAAKKEPGLFGDVAPKPAAGGDPS